MIRLTLAIVASFALFAAVANTAGAVTPAPPVLIGPPVKCWPPQARTSPHVKPCPPHKRARTTESVERRPCPEPYGHPGRCARVTWSYTYTQLGRDQFGNVYVRTCHVPVRRRRWCGPWRRR
jgi:hypothetical protein